MQSKFYRSTGTSTLNSGATAVTFMAESAEALEKSRMMKNKWTPRTRARDVTPTDGY